MNNKAKPSPAPWQAHGCTIYTADRWKDGNNLGGYYVGQAVPEGADDMPSDEQAANATLMAAAPELLEALEELYSHHPTTCIPESQWQGPEADALRKARAAINKATGVQS